MTLSNITDRGTLRGVIYRGAGTGTTDYTQLSNKPQINGHTLQGNQSGDDLDLINKGSLEINEHTLEGSMTGDDLGLVNSADLSFNVGYAGNILHNIKYKNNTYDVYAAPFNGASSGQNGTMGLVPAPLSSQGDYDKFLKGNGRWVKIERYSETTLFEQAYNANFPATITLSESFKNFDALGFYFTKNDDNNYYDFLPVKIFTKNILTEVLNGAILGRTNTIIMTGWQHTNNSQYVRFRVDSDTQFTTTVTGGLWSMYKITGIKFG